MHKIFEGFSHTLILFLMLISFSSFSSFSSFNVPTSAQTIPVEKKIQDNSKMELIQNEIKVEDNEIEPIDTNKVKETVIPNPHQEGKKVMGLFLKTMLAVGFCAILLYFILIFVKKFYSSAFVERENEEIENLDLASPNNKQDAIRSFLNRTK